MRFRIAQRRPAVFHRDQVADVARRARAIHVGTDERREVATRTGNQRRLERHRHRQAPGRVALRLLLVRDGEHPLVYTRGDELGRDDRRRTADRTSGVNAHHRLADRAERVREVQLGHRDALEHVGCLADHDRVDIRPRHARVFECFDGGFAHEAGHRHVLACGAVRGLPDADDCVHDSQPSVGLPECTTRFCCKHGPLDACARPALRFTRGDAARDLADADEAGAHHRVRGERTAGRVDVGLAVEAERIGEDQLLVAELGVQLDDVERALVDPRRACRERRSTRNGVRSRTPRPCASMRCSMPRIHAGRADTDRARSPAASTIAAAPSVIGAMSASRNGWCVTGPASTESTVASPAARPRAGLTDRCAASAPRLPRGRFRRVRRLRDRRSPGARPCRPSKARAARRSTGRSAAS